MEKEYEKKHHDLEETYWWFKARRDFVFKTIKKQPKNAKILDTACSGGVLVKALVEKGYTDVSGLDISSEAVEACEKKGLSNIFCRDAVDTKLEDQQFDVIIASDVLEHIEDEKKAMNEWYRILKPHGTLIIIVPAFQFLWGDSDVLDRHFRRYTRKQLKTVVNRQGLKRRKVFYLNFSLFLPMVLMRILEKIFKKSKDDLKDPLYFVNSFVDSLILFWQKMENIISYYIGVPFGISICAILRKEEQ